MKFNLVFVLIGIVLLFLIFGEEENFTIDPTISKYSDASLTCTSLSTNGGIMTGNCPKSETLAYMAQISPHRCGKDYLGKWIINNKNGRFTCPKNADMEALKYKPIAPFSFIDKCKTIEITGHELKATCDNVVKKLTNYKNCPVDKNGKHLIEYNNGTLKCMKSIKELQRMDQLGLINLQEINNKIGGAFQIN